MTTTQEPNRVEVQQVRRAAVRQGLTLTKNRRRDPYAFDYGLYYLTDDATGDTALDGVTFDEVRAYIRGGLHRKRA